MSRTLVFENVSFTFSLVPASQDSDKYWETLFSFQERAYRAIPRALEALRPTLNKQDDGINCFPYSLCDGGGSEEGMLADGRAEVSVTIHSTMAVPQADIASLRDAIFKVYETEALMLGAPVKFEHAQRFREWRVSERIFVDGV